jgi:hypothetical protein
MRCSKNRGPRRPAPRPPHAKEFAADAQVDPDRRAVKSFSPHQRLTCRVRSGSLTRSRE